MVASIAIKARYDGTCIVPDEPLDLPEGTELEVVVSVRSQTLAEKLLGIPAIVVRGTGPSASEIINEERGPAS